MAKCAHCPLAGESRSCKAEVTRHWRYCEFVDPAHPDHDPAFIGRLKGAAETLVAPRRTLDIPLAGDVVEALAYAIGADRLAKWWEEQTGLPCGCAERKEKLNRATARLLQIAARLVR